MKWAIVLALVLIPTVTWADVCSGCGCKGGPGYRGSNGKCVSWKEFEGKCGDPPETYCTPELVSPTLRALPRVGAPDSPAPPAEPPTQGQ